MIARQTTGAPWFLRVKCEGAHAIIFPKIFRGFAGEMPCGGIQNVSQARRERPGSYASPRRLVQNSRNVWSRYQHTLYGVKSAAMANGSGLAPNFGNAA